MQMIGGVFIFMMDGWMETVSVYARSLAKDTMTMNE
jgi:hypothetical protein